MYLINLILPFFIFMILAFWGHKMGLKGCAMFSMISFMLLFICNIMMFFEMMLNMNTITLDFNMNWFNYDILYLPYKLLFDDLAYSLQLVVISVTLGVLIYSYDYMLNDPHLMSFFSYIMLFVFFMIILVTTSNLVILFVGWEGIGLSSFLLMSYFFTRMETSLGALLAIIMNSMGDIFFLLGIFMGSYLFLSFDIMTIYSINNNINYDMFLLSLFIAAMAKSSQIYLHIWLPYSMEGPTPMSSLIHAATLVTAGIFLLLSLSLLLSYSYFTLFSIIMLGTLTTLLGGSLALTSLDMKELMAYSTISQLGYMMTIIGLKFFNLSFFHLMFHAYFKALLFLTAGAIMHAVLDIQDLSNLGGLFNFLPISYIVLTLGLISLSGIPFTSGFYSKEAIINSSFSMLNSHITHSYIYIFTMISAICTIMYSYQFLLKIFFKTTNLSITIIKHIHHGAHFISLALTFMSIITLFMGFLFYKYIYLYNLPISFYNLNMNIIIKMLPLLFTFIIFILINSISHFYPIQMSILEHQFFFKQLYKSIASSILTLAYRMFYKMFDYGIMDLLFPITSHILYNFSQNINNMLMPNHKLHLIPLFITNLILIIMILT